MLQDSRTLISDGRFDQFYLHIFPIFGEWAYIIDAASYFTPPKMPDDAALLAGLHFHRNSETVRDVPFAEQVDRTPAIEALQRSGRINLPHPWFDVFVPDARMDEYMAEVFASITPEDLGADFPITIFPLKTGLCSRPMLRLPADPVAFLFDLMSTAPDPRTANEMVDRNRRLFARARNLGCKLYLIGATPLTAADWEEHFSPFWERFAAAKRRFDPNGILTPGPGIF
jgi:FAD/FMN-containing dehydrogenase